MKKRSLWKVIQILLIFTVVLYFTSCNSDNGNIAIRQLEATDERQNAAITEGQPETHENAVSEWKEEIPKNHDEAEIGVVLTVGEKKFTALFYNNETAWAFLDQLPLTLDMADLNRNEKFYYLPENLPGSGTQKPATIQAGDIMCWSANSLVLFYETFSNSYGGYVPLGYIEDVTGLSEALGGGNVTVTFSIQQ